MLLFNSEKTKKVHVLLYDTDFYINELSQLVKVYDAKGVLTGQYRYDSVGNCISVTDAYGVVTEKKQDILMMRTEDLLRF